MLAQSNGVPVKVKDIAKVYIGYVPRLGKAGRDQEDDVVAAIVVMNRTLHTNDVAPRIKAEIEKINTDGTLPPGVKLVPFYDRTTLVTVPPKPCFTTSSSAACWCSSSNGFSSAICAALSSSASTFRSRLFFSIIILVLRGEDANLLSVGAVDFGIIVDSAVILVENIFRNCQAAWATRTASARTRGGAIRRRSSGATSTWTDRLRIIFVSALQVDKAVFFSTAVTVAAFVPLFTMQGVEGQIFNPMARTYGYALMGALIATFTVTPVLASYLLPEHIEEAETLLVRALRTLYTPILRWSLSHRGVMVAIAAGCSWCFRLAGAALGTEFLPALEEGNLWIRAAMPPTISLEAGMPIVNRIGEILLSTPK